MYIVFFSFVACLLPPKVDEVDDLTLRFQPKFFISKMPPGPRFSTHNSSS
ncbi:hypothetical protein Dsin_026331 [Dipteronia sinensis]|uniref:Uncharacterized protein n=1 Tax=Dipteronia sinensis TaxID=43782 RepID=A0AAD9ZY36_9ROSI|nr:hypothetical protein Dsin_026331 [Dipteronia sinensis]